jgi:hypothetical protein
VETTPRNIRTAKNDGRYLSIEKIAENEWLEPYFVPRHKNFANARGNPVEQNICPASEGIFWRKLPCLKAVALIKKMKRLPEIEHCNSENQSGVRDKKNALTFITVGDVGVHSTGDSNK